MPAPRPKHRIVFSHLEGQARVWLESDDGSSPRMPKGHTLYEYHPLRFPSGDGLYQVALRSLWQRETSLRLAHEDAFLQSMAWAFMQGRGVRNPEVPTLHEEWKFTLFRPCDTPDGLDCQLMPCWHSFSGGTVLCEEPFLLPQSEYGQAQYRVILKALEDQVTHQPGCFPASQFLATCFRIGRRSRLQVEARSALPLVAS